MQKKRNEGIRVRHSRTCNSLEGRPCNCRPSYEAFVFSGREKKKIRRTFTGEGALAAAKAWRAEATTAVIRGELRTPTRQTLEEAGAEWLEKAEQGEIRNRSGETYKPSVLRSYEASLRLHVYPSLGTVRFSEIRRQHVQDLADRLVATGLDPSTVRNALMPLRSIYRRAVARGVVAVNPTTGLELPAVRGRRDRIASPAEAEQLLAALREADRPLWSTAMYAGLRAGELAALTWADVDLSANLIHVRRSYDQKAHEFVAPKSRAGERKVPIASVLRLHLLEQKARSPWSGTPDGLVFGRTASLPFNYWSVVERARTTWTKAEKARKAALEAGEETASAGSGLAIVPLGLHEARHTFASLMIGAGVNAKALSSFMGHASIVITLDRYGHLFPGAEGEAAALLDRFLERQRETERYG